MKTSRRGAVDPFIVMDVLAQANAAAAAGRDVIHMEVGQPATPAPRLARQAAARALADAPVTPLGYTEALGLPALREGIARLHRDWYGIDLDPGRVIVTAGSSGAFVLAFLALFEAGDEVVIADPGYPSYRNILSALGVRVRRAPTGPETGWQPVPADLGGAAGMLVAGPANPTGAGLPRDRLAALAAAADARGAWLISDEIYHGLTYGPRAVSALEVSDRVVTINSFSKYFSMTGWRVGWMTAPAPLVRTIERLAQNLFICAPHVGQVAALAALDATEELESNRARYAANRALLLEELPRAGFRNFAPADGAFYLWTDVSHLTDDSRDLAARLLAETGIATAPGVDFDPDRGARWLRFSYAGATDDMAEAARRLRAWTRGAPQGGTKPL